MLCVSQSPPVDPLSTLPFLPCLIEVFSSKVVVKNITVPVAFVIWNASLCCWSLSFSKSLSVACVILPIARIIKGITSPFLYFTCCNSSSLRSYWCFSNLSLHIYARYSFLLSFGKVISIIFTSSPSAIVMLGCSSSVPERHDLSFHILAFGCVFINSFAIFLTT